MPSADIGEPTEVLRRGFQHRGHGLLGVGVHAQHFGRQHGLGAAGLGADQSCCE